MHGGGWQGGRRGGGEATFGQLLGQTADGADSRRGLRGADAAAGASVVEEAAVEAAGTEGADAVAGADEADAKLARRCWHERLLAQVWARGGRWHDEARRPSAPCWTQEPA